MNFDQSSLGGGKKGIQPLLFGHASSGSDRALSRKHLTKAFGNLHLKGLNNSPALYSKNILGPFRTHFNAGDILVNSPQPTNIKYGKEANQVGGNNLARSALSSSSDFAAFTHSIICWGSTPRCKQRKASKPFVKFL